MRNPSALLEMPPKAFGVAEIGDRTIVNRYLSFPSADS
jgi:hypothetical protein